jgi:hypothetical protein
MQAIRIYVEQAGQYALPVGKAQQEGSIEGVREFYIAWIAATSTYSSVNS